MNYSAIAKRVILEEASALKSLASAVPTDFQKLVEYIVGFKGKVILTGMGKSGYIAHKVAASFASTGTVAFYIHPAEASHGDLGVIEDGDLMIMLSNSGETKELFDIVNYCKRFSIKIAGMTMNANSNIGTSSDFLLLIPPMPEASLIAAPTTSSLMMLALGDALTTAVQEAKGFSRDNFHLYHPGGKIGASLLKVRDLMHGGDRLPVVYKDTSFTETIIIMTQKSLGCALVIDEDYRLAGIITDGDLRRHVNERVTSLQAGELMTENPQSVLPRQFASEALYLMNSRAITVLPVTEEGKLIGVIHIHDLLKAGV